MTNVKHPAGRNNAAARLFHLFTLVLQTANPGQTQTLSVWQEVFGVSPGEDAEHTVAELLKVVHRELGSIQTALHAHGVPIVLIDPYINQFRQAVSLNHLPQTINHVVPKLDQTGMLSLSWFAHLLPEEDQPTTEAMNGFASEITELESALRAEGIPPAFRAHAEGVLAGLKSALALFPVQGIGALKPVVRKAVSDAHFDEEALKNELSHAENRSSVKRVRDTVTSVVKTAAGFTGDLDKVFTTYGKFLEKAHGAGQFISDVLAQSPSQ